MKVNAPELLRAGADRADLCGEHIAMGTNVDCYQRAEGRYGLMREHHPGAQDARNPFSILTKGTLILRDLDLLRAVRRGHRRLAERLGRPSSTRRCGGPIEPGTPPRTAGSRVRRADRRRAPLRRADGPGLRRASPTPPRSSRRPSGMPRPRARSHVTPLVLHLRPGAREWFFGWLRESTRPWSPGTPSSTAAAPTRRRTTRRGSGPRFASSPIGTASGAAAAFAASGWPRAGAVAAAGPRAWALTRGRGRAAGRTSAPLPGASSCRCSETPLTF